MNEEEEKGRYIIKTWDRIVGEVVAFSGGLWTHIWSNLSDWLPALVGKAWAAITDVIESMLETTKKSLNQTTPGFTVFNDLMTAEIERMWKLPFPWDILGIVSAIIAGPMLYMKEKIRLRLLPMAHGEAQSALTDIPPVEVLMREFFRTPDNQTLITDFLEKHNYGELSQSILLASAQNYGDLNSIFVLRNRGLIPSDGVAVERIQKLGFSETNATQLLELRNVIPALPDIIRMAIREAFDKEAVKRFHLMDHYPDLLTDWAAKQGLSKEWAENYWKAHWTLPSMGQGFEMLWRTDFSDADLDLLMRVADINPYFRPFLKEIAYHPLTRVDTRRMYGLGVLDRAGVKRAYLDLGYNELNAERMTEFTVRYENRSHRNEAISRVTWARKQGIYDSKTAYKMYLVAGLNKEDAEYELAGVDAEVLVDLVNDKIDHVKTLYTSRRIDLNTASDMLDVLPLFAEGKADLIEMWDEKRIAKARYPSDRKSVV